MNNNLDPWFLTGPARGPVELKMFCFPYAGGSAMIFRRWADSLPPTVQVIPVELPGRGARLKEEPLVSLPVLIDELEPRIHPLLDQPFVLFGHSMGAMIAFELARALRRKHGREPQALLVAGRRAPQIPWTEPVTYDLPRDEFIEELIKLDGTPKEVLEHAELMELMIPLLRADFQLVQTYQYQAGTPLQCPISVYGGLEDHETPREKLLPWKEMTASGFAVQMLPGDHFFIRSNQSQLLELVGRELREAINRSRSNRGPA
ncbi:MAG TPA: alpha/beta fold hydrolase [Blastocatellia bacterium]|nr:alpha/beta fold hydrolase [Blastocatellia bacterium]